MITVPAPRRRVLAPLARRPVVVRLTRCFAVSVGTTLLSATILVVLAVGAGISAGIANAIAVCCGIGPSYYANRHWVWGRSGRADMVRETIPFWLLSIAGLAASTVAVAFVGAATADWSNAARVVLLPAANLSVFGALWLAQFLVLDKVLFSSKESSS